MVEISEGFCYVSLVYINLFIDNKSATVGNDHETYLLHGRVVNDTCVVFPKH